MPSLAPPVSRVRFRVRRLAFWLAIITYHSGEDRLVKHAFRDWARACVCPPEQPICTCRGRLYDEDAYWNVSDVNAESVDGGMAFLTACNSGG